MKYKIFLKRTMGKIMQTSRTKNVVINATAEIA